MYTKIEQLHKDLEIEYIERCHGFKYEMISGLGTYVHIPENTKKREKRPNYFLFKE